MNDPKYIAPETYRFPAIVEMLPGYDPNHGVRCRLYHEHGCVDAWTWLSLDPTPNLLHWGWVSTMDIGSAYNDLLLLGLRENHDQPLSNLLPEILCPINGVVRQVSALIDGLRNKPLRRFMTRALLNQEALHGYWTSPASRRDHHAYPGGLAEHSLEVATMLATSTGLPEEDRELGIVFALLHDYGKIWCYDPIAFDPVNPREHEAHGLAKLEFDLLYLRRDNARLGDLMVELLGGARAPREGRYPLAIGRIVRSFDQMSCEKTRRTLTKSPTTLAAEEFA
jgi:hypothetical protein